MANLESKGWSYERLEKEWLDAKKPIAKQYGFTWKGASPRITDDYEWAKAHIREYDISGQMSYWELSMRNTSKGETLVFIEYSESDML